jgi:cysteinyl-tRNA synthetase
VVRFFMLQAHYRSVLDFSNDALLAAEKGFDRLVAAVALLESRREQSFAGPSAWSVSTWQEACTEAMNDDFNSPILIAHLFDAVKAIQADADGRERLTDADSQALLAHLRSWLYDVLGLHASATEGSKTLATALDAAMEAVIQLRQKARAEKDFQTSDAIRGWLAQGGIVLKDGKDGTTYAVER